VDLAAMLKEYVGERTSGLLFHNWFSTAAKKHSPR
jgi:hypothetical protein